MRITPIIGIIAFSALTPSALLAAGPSSRRDQLVIGQHVKVEGRAKDGVFQAQSVTLRDAENTVKVEGVVGAVSDGGRRLQILDFPVSVDASTRLYRGTQPAGSRSILVAGSWIEVKGTWQRGVLKASRIRVKATPEATEEIEGVIQSIDPAGHAMVVLDRRILLPQGAGVLDERTGRAPKPQSDRLRRDDDDGAGRQPIALGNVVIGGRVEGGFADEENFNVGATHAERTVLSRVQMLASSQITSTVEGYAKVTLTRNMPSGGSAEIDARLSEGYLMVHRVGGAPINLQIGRQRFRDSREWWFDEYLDALRVHVALPAVSLEAAVSRGVFSGDPKVRARRDQPQFIASAKTRAPGAQVGVYVLARRDTTRNERPVWVGGTIDGRAGIAWSYWGDVVARRGTSATSRLAGWAFDTGVKHRWSRRWSPTVTAGYAFGSGDRTRGDGLDTRFRQTDLEDNQAYFGGLRRVAAYGELFDPELSNLHVMTAGFGMRPTRGFSVDAIYHRFAQATASSSLPSGRLDGDLNGRSRALGDELNVVLTYRAARGVDLDLALGTFRPGPAFERITAPAFFWRPQIRFYF